MRKRINNIIIKTEKQVMKKKATVLIASIMAFCGINTAHADEGMWTIYNLPNAVYEMMQREGFSMTYDQLYNGEDALKNAVVNFSGYCSGVVVSPDGLVFTNHHCGFELSEATLPWSTTTCSTASLPRASRKNCPTRTCS